jgi:hypothetical protein
MAGEILHKSGIPGFNFDSATLGEVVSQMYQLTLLLMGFVVFYWLVWGAYQYIMAGGNKEGLAKAKARITWALIGLVVIVLAYLITTFAAAIIKPRSGLPTFGLIPTAYAEVKIGDEFDFGDITNLGQGTDRFIVPIFSIASVLVLLFFLYGAFKILTSAGDKREVEAGQQAITHAIIGFVILMAAFVLINFVLSGLFGINGLQLIKGL